MYFCLSRQTPGMSKSKSKSKSASKKIRVSIIGTAGRHGSYRKMNGALYQKMIDFSIKVVGDISTNPRNRIPIENITLVSGGAALADHLAVILYLRGVVHNLHLHLPCKYDMDLEKYENTSNGNTSNTHHLNFSNHLGPATLPQIGEAIRKGATIDVSDGFFTRNRLVADCDYLLAFTFSTLPSGNNIKAIIPNSNQTDITLQGGTGNTWKISTNSIKIHVPISCLDL